MGSGELSGINPLHIAADGKAMTKLSGTSVELPMALVLLMGVFYFMTMSTPAFSS